MYHLSAIPKLPLLDWAAATLLFCDAVVDAGDEEDANGVAARDGIVDSLRNNCVSNSETDRTTIQLQQFISSDNSKQFERPLGSAEQNSCSRKTARLAASVFLTKNTNSRKKEEIIDEK